jgi:hypothetical protein
MTTNAGSEGPSVPTIDPVTPETQRRTTGFVMLVAGWAMILVGLVGLFFFFLVPALVLVLAGIPVALMGSRGFAHGKERLARGPGRAD